MTLRSNAFCHSVQVSSDQAPFELCDKPSNGLAPDREQPQVQLMGRRLVGKHLDLYSLFNASGGRLVEAFVVGGTQPLTLPSFISTGWTSDNATTNASFRAGHTALAVGNHEGSPLTSFGIVALARSPSPQGLR